MRNTMTLTRSSVGTMSSRRRTTYVVIERRGRGYWSETFTSAVG
jgi:hypothetical protein